MKPKFCIYTLIIFLFFSSSLFAQPETTQDNSNPGSTGTTLKPGNIIFSLGVGYPELISFKLGYQINSAWSVSAKVSAYYNGYGDKIYLGTIIWGLKITRYYEPIFLNINSISFEPGYDKDGIYSNYSFDVYVGYESIKNSFINPFWSLGISFIKTYDHKLYITPGLKAGLKINF
ncbi:MAG: hypothetical protein R6W90_00415 [Ignavibacteriaceae bacterium]